MTDRTELLEAALNSLPEGIALFDGEHTAIFWNQAAEAITGHAGAELVGRPIPVTLKALLQRGASPMDDEQDAGSEVVHGFPAHARHRLGHELCVMARVLVLRDGLGGRLGTAVLFHSTNGLDALPSGEAGDGEGVKVSQTDLKERLGAEFEDFVGGGESFGVLWITVDQAHGLRKTHGASACNTMIEKVAQALAKGLRPTEKLGRWGEDEFLVVSHERTQQMLAAHAQALAGLARTTDFRWWGDRLSITVSIGAAQAEQTKTLADLLGRAKAAMLSSSYEGGNRITTAPGGQSCLPS